MGTQDTRGTPSALPIVSPHHTPVLWVLVHPEHWQTMGLPIRNLSSRGESVRWWDSVVGGLPVQKALPQTREQDYPPPSLDQPPIAMY